MKNILIIGAGEFGKHLANKMASLNNGIRILDADEKVIASLPDTFEDTMIGDGCNMNVIEQLGVPDFDICVVSVGGNFQSSLAITSNLKECKAKYIIAQCQSDLQAKFLKMAGADRTVYAEKEAAEKVALVTSEDKLLDILSISDEYSVVKIHLPVEWEGHTLPELHLRDKYGINVLAIEKGGKVFVPDIKNVFAKGDLILVLGNEKNLAKLFHIKHLRK